MTIQYNKVNWISEAVIQEIERKSWSKTYPNHGSIEVKLLSTRIPKQYSYLLMV